MFRTESPHYISVQQGLNHLGVQQGDVETKGDRFRTVQHRAKPFEACAHETDASFGFKREVNIVVEIAVEVYQLGRLYSSGQLLGSRSVKLEMEVPCS